MKKFFRHSALGIALAVTAFGTVPAQAQSWGQYETSRDSHRERDNVRRDYNRHDDERYDNRYENRYDNRYDGRPAGYGYYGGPSYYHEGHGGRDAAIIGGSAVAGAVIGGAAGHGQGAAVGAVVGVIAGVVADQAIRHHDGRY